MKSSFDLGLPSKCLVSSSDISSSKDNKESMKELTEIEVSIDKLFEDLDGEICELESLILNYNSFDMIAALSFKELACNPETFRECDHEGIGAVVEYISLLYLKHPFNEGKSPVDSRGLVSVSEMAKRIFSSVNLYYAIKAHEDSMNGPAEALEELKYFSVNNELYIRNPSYHHHLKKAIIDIFQPLNYWILENLGFTIDDTMMINDKIESFINTKLTNHRTKTIQNESNLIKQLRKYRSTKKIIDESNYAILNELSKYSWKEAVEKLRIYVGEDSLSSFGCIYAFTARDISERSNIPIERVQSYFNLLSIEFGSVESEMRMLSPTHELKSRPFISNKGKYICPNPQLLLSALQSTLEKTLNPDSSLAVNKNRHLWDKFIDIRANYVERESIKMIQDTLRDANCYNNLTYKSHGKNNSQCELDGLIIFDGNLLLIECKAGNLTQSARRGSKERLLKDLNSLIIDAHNQALRAKNYIDSIDTPKFISKDKREVIIDKSAIRRIFLINVTLEQFDAFTVALNKTAKLGLFKDKELPWAVSFFDLMVICEMTEFPSQFIHYLIRRLQLNELDNIAAHDELDWFGNYLHEGLYFHGIADTRFNQIYLTTYTTDFDDYYIYKNGERKTQAPKPVQAMPRRLHDIIIEIDASHKPGHSEVVCKLLDMDYNARKVFSKQFDEFRSRSSKDKRFHDFSLILTDKLTETNSGLSCFVLPSNRDAINALDRLDKYIAYKKLQTQAENWLGIITILDESKLINSWII